MSKRTDEDLQKIISAKSGDYQPEALEAANEEIEKRKFLREKLSKYTDEQILEILKSRKVYQSFEVQTADEEAEKRNLHFDLENRDEKSEFKPKEKTELKNSQTNEANKNYKVVPFNPSNNVPSSLQSIINSEAVNGWKYVNHQYSDKLKPGSAGCFGIGATSDSTIHIGFVVFEKKQ